MACVEAFQLEGSDLSWIPIEGFETLDLELIESTWAQVPGSLTCPAP